MASFVIVNVLPDSDAATTVKPTAPLGVTLPPVRVIVGPFSTVDSQPAYVWESVKQDSIWDTTLRASDFADESCALALWPRNVGSAIAARMPMIRMTTSSSMSVKPSSSFLKR